MNKLDLNQIKILTRGDTPPPGFEPLANLPLVIMVGLTGAGKTTTLEQLAQTGVEFTLLPNRREITDAIIIPAMQKEEGSPPGPVTDRLKRFEYTARYRARYPGGMAHALARLAVRPVPAPAHLIFDGLRGLNEVQQAVEHFPLARFVILDAADAVRLARLLHRGDRFDAATLPGNAVPSGHLQALMAVPEVETVFTPAQLRQIAGLAGSGQFTVAEVVKKVAIIVEERRNYDSTAARRYLAQTLPHSRALVVDTAARPVEDVARTAAQWLNS